MEKLTLADLVQRLTPTELDIENYTAMIASHLRDAQCLFDSPMDRDDLLDCARLHCKKALEAADKRDRAIAMRN